MRWHGMPWTWATVASLVSSILFAMSMAACRAAPAPRPAGSRPLGLPEDFDLEAEAARGSTGPPAGSGATVDRVELALRNRSDRARELSVVGVERLHAACGTRGWDDVRGLTVHAPAKVVAIEPAEALRLAVVFEPVECANVCDRFGFRVHVRVDGHPVVIDALLDGERPE